MIFRAFRFGFHLARHYPSLLMRELRAAAASILYWPAYKRMQRHVPQNIEMLRASTVAFDSPDHVQPHGTAFNHMTHFGFIVKMTRQCGRASMLDLGCSSGRLVRDFRRAGWVAVGLEGSDYSLKHRRPCWDTEAGVSLFTCDIGRPFRISYNTFACTLAFDLITAFQVLEHLDKERLRNLMFNVELHSKPGTLFVISATAMPEVVNGVELHVTRWNRAQWVEFFAEHLPKWRIGKPVPDHLMMRRSVEDLDFTLRRV